MCRQSIIIERPEDLAGCLRTIADDPHVEVLSKQSQDLKNRPKAPVNPYPNFHVFKLSFLLRFIFNKPVHVQVVRVKNRFTPLHNSAQSAGYRDIAVNLRLATPEARRLGVASHVCEVQIILKAFTDLKVLPIPNVKSCCIIVITTNGLCLH